MNTHVREMNAHVREIENLCISKNEKHLLSTSKDGTVRLWDLTSQTLLITRVHNFCHPINSISLSEKAFAVNSRDESKVWFLNGNVYPFNKPISHCILLTSQPKMIFLSEKNAFIQNLETNSETPLRLSENLFDFYTVLVHLSLNEKLIAQFCIDNSVRLWKTENDKQIAWLKGHTSFVKGIRFSENEERAITFSNDNTIRIWDWKTGEFGVIHTSSIDDACIVSNLIYSFHNSNSSIRVWKNTNNILTINSVQQFVFPYCIADKSLYRINGLNFIKITRDKFLYIRSPNTVSIGTKLLVKTQLFEAKDVSTVTVSDSFVIIGYTNGMISLKQKPEHTEGENPEPNQLEKKSV